MRKIKSFSIFVSALLIATVILFSFGLSYGLHSLLPSFEYRPIFVSLFFVFLFFTLGLFTYRLSAQTLFPVPLGEIRTGTKDEFNYEVMVLLQLIFWSPLTRAIPWPVPMSRLVFRLLGADIDKNSYSGGIILDPFFVKVGKNCLFGHQSMLCPHALEGDKIYHERIEVGDNVTIGAFAIVLAGCKIGDGAILGMNSVLPKGTQIGPREIWAGNPARYIKSRDFE